MNDPFAIHNPTETKPVHRPRSRFFFRKQKGHMLDDYTVSEGRTPYLGLSADMHVFRIFLFVLLVFFALFIARAAYLQLTRGEYYRGVAEGNRIRIERLPATRGLFFDRFHTLLAENVPEFVLMIRPVDLSSNETDQQLLYTLLAPYGIQKEEITAVIDSHAQSREWIPVRGNIGHDQAIELMAILTKVPGIAVMTGSQRSYLLDGMMSLSHVFGYVGRPSIEDLSSGIGSNPSQLLGKAGLEKTYDAILHGIDGKKEIEVDALGKEREVLAQENPENGTHIILTIDAELQKIAEEVLTRNLTASQKKRGAVVMIDPRDGAIRALVSWPSFDANAFGQGLSSDAYQALLEDQNNPLFPRAISGMYPSGSTIKPIFAAGALEDSIITPQTTVQSVGGIYIGQWFFPDWKAGGHGLTNVYRAIAESVNTFFYYIGGGYGNFEGLGPNRLALWAKRFGLGTQTNIDLPGEAAGFIPTQDWKERERNELWYIGDTYHFAIGQGDVLVTPLQMALVAATVGNGGTRYEPHLVSAYQDSTGNETTWTPVTHDDVGVSLENINVVQNAMRQTVISETGSARSMQIVSAAVAGKTGTAQWNSTKDPHSWFIGFAPYQNPTISIAVLVEEGGNASMAVPVAREILSWYFMHRDE